MSSISLTEYKKLYGKQSKTTAKSKRQPRGAKVESIGESLLATQLKALKIEFKREFKFHPERKWKADFLITGKQILVEVEGGIWSGGRHTRGKGYTSDCEKYAEAMVLGLAVLRFTTQQVMSGYAINSIERLLK